VQKNINFNGTKKPFAKAIKIVQPAKALGSDHPKTKRGAKSKLEKEMTK
jgi:hypothetical protein